MVKISCRSYYCYYCIFDWYRCLIKFWRKFSCFLCKFFTFVLMFFLLTFYGCSRSRFALSHQKDCLLRRLRLVSCLAVFGCLSTFVPFFAVNFATLIVCKKSSLSLHSALTLRPFYNSAFVMFFGEKPKKHAKGYIVGLRHLLAPPARGLKWRFGEKPKHAPA